MSELVVKAIRVDEVAPHPNADRLDIIKVLGWNCVVSKGSLRVGDWVIYFPIDSVLPLELENRIFGDGSKVKLNGKKVKTIKLRGVYSQGLAVPLTKFPEYADSEIDADLTDSLGVKKWEPTEAEPKGLSTNGKKASHKELNPYFKKYTDLNHLKSEMWKFTEGEEVVATEKLHGSSGRGSLLPNSSNVWWKWLLWKLRLLPKYEFCYGSRNVQLQTRWLKPIYHELPSDIYTKAIKQYNLRDKIQPNEAVYGEILGAGIQKGYAYGHAEGEISFHVYDVHKDGRWLDHDELQAWCKERELTPVPTLYRGPFDLEVLAKLVKGPSTVVDAPSKQPIREGIVVRPVKERCGHGGRSVSKFVSEDFLLRNDEDGGTDWH